MIQKLKQIKESIQLIYKLNNDVQLQQEQILELYDLKEYNQKVQALLEHEQLTKQYFKEEEKKIQGLLEREEWTRQRFQEEEEKIQGLLEREEWTRQQFEEIRSHIYTSSISNMSYEKNFYEKMTYSQSGEDSILLYILNFIGIPWYKVSYLDLGANHPIHMNNTYSLYQRGAKGVLVEANPELISELRNVRKNDVILNKVITNETGTVKFYVMSGDGLSTMSYEEARIACERNKEISIKEVYEIETIRLEQILETYFVESPTVLSIDLEGVERQILETFDFKKYRPLIIILEDIPYYPYLVINQREEKVADIMKENGYIEYAFTGINVIYIDKQQIDMFNHSIIEKQKENHS